MTIKECLNVVLQDDATDTGGTSCAGETLFDFLSSFCDADLQDINMDDDVSVLDDLLKQNGIWPIKKGEQLL